MVMNVSGITTKIVEKELYVKYSEVQKGEERIKELEGVIRDAFESVDDNEEIESFESGILTTTYKGLKNTHYYGFS